MAGNSLSLIRLTSLMKPWSRAMVYLTKLERYGWFCHVSRPPQKYLYLGPLVFLPLPRRRKSLGSTCGGRSGFPLPYPHCGSALPPLMRGLVSTTWIRLVKENHECHSSWGAWLGVCASRSGYPRGWRSPPWTRASFGRLTGSAYAHPRSTESGHWVGVHTPGAVSTPRGFGM